MTDAAQDTRPEPSPTQWQLFEQQVARLLDELGGNASVEHDAHIEGRLSKRDRQVDVLIRDTVADHEVILVCECKRYTKRIGIGIGMVDEMVGKVLDIGASAGIMYALSGYTAPAKARADGASNPKIELRELPAEADAHYSELMQWLIGHDCPGCEFGVVSWGHGPTPMAARQSVQASATRAARWLSRATTRTAVRSPRWTIASSSATTAKPSMRA